MFLSPFKSKRTNRGCAEERAMKMSYKMEIKFSGENQIYFLMQINKKKDK